MRELLAPHLQELDRLPVPPFTGPPGPAGQLAACQAASLLRLAAYSQMAVLARNRGGSAGQPMALHMRALAIRLHLGVPKPTGFSPSQAEPTGSEPALPS